MRIADYDDFLNSLSLKGLKEEAKTFDKSNRRVGLRILKLIAEKLRVNNSSNSLFNAYDMQRWENKSYVLASDDRSSKRL